MKKRDKNKEGGEAKKDQSAKPYEKWKDPEKNRMGNDIHSEIKIANAQGEMEGGENKQWHMDQGNFDEQEKSDFENKGDKPERHS